MICFFRNIMLKWKLTWNTDVCRQVLCTVGSRLRHLLGENSESDVRENSR